MLLNPEASVSVLLNYQTGIVENISIVELHANITTLARPVTSPSQ